MRVVVIGGSGRIGARLVGRLRREGHAVTAASRSTGVDSQSGEGLAAAMDGADVAVDVSNPPASGEVAAPDFFLASGRNIAAAARAADLRHLVVLSVVGADRLGEGDYFRGKLVQEGLAARSRVPCTLLRATQFFEFIRTIADAGGAQGSVRVPAALVQPVAADDVAAMLARIVTQAPHRRTIELAGPEVLPLAGAVRRVLASAGDPRAVAADPDARYFGVRLGQRTLLPGAGAHTGPTRLDGWLAGPGARELT